MKHARFIFLFLLFISYSFSQTVTITGTVIDSNSGELLPAVNIVYPGGGVATSDLGTFQLEVPMGTPLTFSHIGYVKQIISVKSISMIVRLSPDIIEGAPVLVHASRAVAGVTPIAFSTLDPSEIEMRYNVQDVPMVLASEPGVFAYSESGNGTGYSYVSIRGFDQSRIAVMLDGVPLNDNESHQVYWVDHGDILSDAADVQIQRGIGNSLYGASAFGGSINVQTRIASDVQTLRFTGGIGSYNTNKIMASYRSGQTGNRNLSLSLRGSSIKSDGYREYHNSLQNAVAAGLEHRGKYIINQLRINLGYENTQLVWDGIPATDINNRILRRQSYQGFTDDFHQQIYSLNTIWKINPVIQFTNTAYMVKGQGYYRVKKQSVNWYEYNLDIQNVYSDSMEMSLLTDLSRRKWIVNSYFGLVPTITYHRNRYRLDIGAELRKYTGNHFGEVSQFSDSSLARIFTNDWYRYYSYTGSKFLLTGFIHANYQMNEKLTLSADLQSQRITWNLDQNLIGHSSGHELAAIWTFINPRIGALYNITPELNLFLHYGKGQKEPADNQIIEADDVWGQPKLAAAELVQNYEAGFSFDRSNCTINVNAYIIDYNNEQLKNIDIKKEGEYDYYSEDKTRHTGIEAELHYNVSEQFQIGLNGSISDNRFKNGSCRGNYIPTVPAILVNGIATYRTPRLTLSFQPRYVGQQYLDKENTGTIDPALVCDAVIGVRYSKIELSLRIDNLFDMLYETYGYGYSWDESFYAYYWPGATRNIFATISSSF